MKRSGISALHVVGGLVLIAAVGGAVWMALRADRTGQTSKVYDYDLSPFRKVDPALVLYEEPGPPIATGMTEPTGIALDSSDRIYLAGDKEVRVLDAQGARLRQVPMTDHPRCLTVTADGTIYVATRDHVEVFDPAGNRTARWDKAGPKAYLTSILVHDEAVFVADYGHRVVRKYDRTGKLLKVIDGKDAAEPGQHFSIPSPFFDVAIDPCDQLVIANTGKHTVEVYDLDGQRKAQWGRFGTDIEGFAGCCNPANFAIQKDGSFVTAEKGLTRVKLYGPDGTFVGVVAPPSAFERHDALCDGNLTLSDRAGLDVAVDSKGRVLVLDPLTAEVRVFVKKSAGGEKSAITKPTETTKTTKEEERKHKESKATTARKDSDK